MSRAVVGCSLLAVKPLDHFPDRPPPNALTFRWCAEHGVSASIFCAACRVSVHVSAETLGRRADADQPIARRWASGFVTCPLCSAIADGIDVRTLVGDGHVPGPVLGDWNLCNGLPDAALYEWERRTRDEQIAAQPELAACYDRTALAAA